MNNDNPKLSKVQRFDSLPMNSTYFTDEGYLIDNPIVTTCGIFEYLNNDGSIRRELRLPEEVFAKRSLDSYKGKPVIITHKAGEINKDNVEDEIIGTILSDGYRDGDNVRAEIIIHDTDAMKKCGLKELSLGYNLTLDEISGEWNGEHYDAIQRNIEINHLALVDEARAGENARLNIDGKHSKGGKVMSSNRHDENEALENAIEAFKNRNENTSDTENAPATLPNDTEEQNKGVENSDEENPEEVDEVQLVKDRRERRDAEGEPTDLNGAIGVIAQQDEDIDVLIKLIEALKAKNDYTEADAAEETNKTAEVTEQTEENYPKNLNMDSIDKLVSAKLELCRLGDKVGVNGIEGMSINDAKKAIIKNVKPSVRLDGKSDAYIEAMFDIAKADISAQRGTDAQRRSMFNSDGKNRTTMSAAQEARERMIKRQNGGN